MVYSTLSSGRGTQRGSGFIPPQRSGAVTSTNTSTKKTQAESTLPSVTRPTNAQAPQIDAPSANLMDLAEPLGAQMRSTADAQANQSIQSLTQRTGGDASSPLFQLLSTMARGQAAGQAGGQLANLKFQAADADAGRDLSRQQANLSARLQAQGMTDQFALSSRGLDLQGLQLNQNAQQTQSNDLLQRLQLLHSTYAGGRPTGMTDPFRSQLGL